MVNDRPDDGRTALSHPAPRQWRYRTLRNGASVFTVSGVPVDRDALVAEAGRDLPGHLRHHEGSSSHDVFVGTTVLLEAEWVLRSAYGYPPPQVRDALRAFAGLPRVTLEDPALAATALDGMAAGMDFTDALHLAKAEGCAAFVSFDQRLARTAKRLSTVAVRRP